MRDRFTIVIYSIIVLVFISSCAKKDVKSDESMVGMSAAAASGPTPSTDQVNDLKKIYFDTDRATLRADARHDLLEDVSWLKAHPTSAVRIEGNCDERGSEEHNEKLGMQRATTVKTFLAKHGIKRRRLTVISNGKSRPVDPGHDESAWRQNRRVAFSLNS